MAGEPGRDGAVEDVEAEGDAAEQVVDLADPEQVLGRRLGQERRGHRQHRGHLLLVAAEGAADRDAVDAGLGDVCGRFAAQVLVGAALDDPNTAWRAGPLSLVPGEAAVEPAMGALGRAGGVLAVGVEGRALVEDEGDVGAERRLDLIETSGEMNSSGRRA